MCHLADKRTDEQTTLPQPTRKQTTSYLRRLDDAVKSTARRAATCGHNCQLMTVIEEGEEARLNLWRRGREVDSGTTDGLLRCIYRRSGLQTNTRGEMAANDVFY